MSLAIKYETVEDASMRLRGTVVLYKGEPVQITEVTHGDGGDDIIRVKFRELPIGVGDRFGRAIVDPEAAKVEQRKFISSKHFDIAPFKLGYVNHPKTGAFYCTRLPNRIQKQGLCTENFQAKTNMGEAVPFTTFLTCKEVVAMIKGVYPSFDRALVALNQCPSVAFSYEFSLMKDDVIPDLIYLYHKGNKVGYFSKNEVLLGQKFKCLKESLQEMQVKVGVC